MWQNVLASSIVMIVFIFFIVGLYGILNLKKIKTRKQFFKQMHQDLKVGKSVVISGSLYGTLTRVGDETVDIKTKSGAVIEVSRYAITAII